MWPPTLLGIALFTVFYLTIPGVLAWAWPVLMGLALAIPYTVLTASPFLGRMARRVGLCATPEELNTPAILIAATRPRQPAPAMAAE
jgi:membrane glycosyltransferase